MIRHATLIISLLITLSSYAHPFEEVDHYINSAIAGSYFPGAQLIVGNKEGVIYSQSYGYLDYELTSSVSDSTIYDLASCTKPLATTLAIMKLYDQRAINLNTRVGNTLERYRNSPFAEVRLRELLRHDSGFAPVIPVNCMLNRERELDSLFGARLDSLINIAYIPTQRGKHIYSDINFYLTGLIVEHITGATLREYTAKIYEDMGIENLDFNPLEWYDIDNIAPTEFDPIIRHDTIRGVVHDEFTYAIGGVCGSAGLFGSAKSVAEVCGMFLRGGVDYRGHRVLKASTIDRFSRAKQFRTGGVFALGFNKINPKKMSYPANSYGHTGFTGTYFWIDPKEDVFVILLTNRVHPTRENRQLNSQWREYMWELINSIVAD